MSSPKKKPKPPLTQSLCPFYVPQCRTVFLWSSAGSTLKSRRIGVVQTHIRSFSLFCTQICISAPVEGSAPEKRFLVSHSSDSSWFKWTLLVEMVLLVHLAQRSCQSCSWPARSPILPGLADAPEICLLCTAQPSLHTGSPQFCPLAELWEPLQPQCRCSREIWAGLICYQLTHRYTSPFNE